MFAILFTKFKLLRRSPWSFILLTLGIIGFSYVVGMNFTTKTEIAVFSTESKESMQPLLDELNEMDTFSYVWYGKSAALTRVKENKNELAVELKKDEATIYVSANSQNEQLVEYEILSAYQKQARQTYIASLPAADTQKLAEKLDALEDYQTFEIEKVSFQSDESFIYDSSLQSIFGFSLFFVIYTIAFNVVSILTEKQEGVWDRILLSPVSKGEMYAGNLLYCFMTGYVQVALVFLVFRYGLHINFYGAFGKTLVILIPYVFCIIALTLFIASLVKNIQQYNVIIPLVSVSMAMIGGAYWPLEIVTSDVMIVLSKFMPITYAMEALKGATIYGQDWPTLMYPVLLMILIGIVLMGLGIKLIDRR